MTRGAPVIYIPHGGGPLPLLDHDGHRELVDFLRSVPVQWRRPEAILVVSAHWEETRPTVQSGSRPPMLYDYYGFPAETYAIEYPAPGAPDIAEHMFNALDHAGMEPSRDPERGYDHGLYVPLMLMYPAADIPCLQISLVRGLDPDVHLRLGEALASLRRHNVLVIGSGLSFHNLRAMGTTDPAVDKMNLEFHRWLLETTTGGLAPDELRSRLVGWESAPGARTCHPREEHFIPLHVCAGIASLENAVEVFSGSVMGRRTTALLWR